MADAWLANAAVYRKLLGARLRSDYQYRTSFWLRTAAGTILTLLDFAVIVLLFGRVEHLRGWSLSEVALLYGLNSVAFNGSNLVIGGVDYLSLRVKAGTFDRVLTRPLSALFHLAAEEFALRRVGYAAQAVAVAVSALVVVDVDWNLWRVAQLVALLASGGFIYGSLFVLAGSIAFWTVEAAEFPNAFTYGGNYLNQYPTSIYSEWMRRFVMFVIPLAFVAYFPSLPILGRTSEADRLGLPAFVMYASPLVAIVVTALAAVVWRLGLRHYRSTGS